MNVVIESHSDESLPQIKEICIAVIGTRGDIFPVLALINLLNDGHKIKVISSPNNSKLFQSLNVDFYAIGDDFSNVVRAGDIAYYRDQIGIQFDTHHDIYKNADVIIGAGLFYAGRTLAEYFGKKYHHLFYTPQVLKSDTYAPAGNKRPYRSKLVNRLLWLKSLGENDFILKNLINSKRTELGLDPIKNVYGYFIDHSNTVIAADDKLAKIPSNYSTYIKQINCLCYEDPKPIDDVLQTFLENGSKPVLINFGSAEYGVTEFQELLRNTIDCVCELGHRAVVISTMKIEDPVHDKNVLFCEYAPYKALLPKVSSIIHHGGIGTVYSTLKSGIPQIVIPQILDQHYWAEMVKEKRLGGVVYPDGDSYSSQLRDTLIDTLSSNEIHNTIQVMKDWLNSQEYKEASLEKLKIALPECFIQ